MDTTAGLEPPRTPLDAGQEGRTALSVRNDSEIVEDYSFQVLGDLAEWSSVEPTHVTVFPGQSATAVLIFRLPRSSAVPAGEHPYGVHVRPAKRPENAAVPEGILEVLPFYDTVAELSPQSTKSTRGGKYRVAVDNRGNAPVVVALTGKSASDGLDLTLGESRLTMEPGTTWSSEVRAEPVKRLWRGTPAAYPFTVMVTPEEGPAVALAGTQYQDPVLPAWSFKALLGALVLAVALPLGVWTARAGTFPPWDTSTGSEPTGPETTSPETAGEETPGPEATGGGETAGEEVTSPETAGEETTGGETTGPEATGEETTGEETTEPESPSATGPDTVLPEMVGRQAEPLIDELELLGVYVALNEVLTVDAEPGTVLRTEPVGGSTVQPGDTVEMWVAIEPSPTPSFPAEISVPTPPNGEPVDWPAESATGPFTVTSMEPRVIEEDVGTLRVELLGPAGAPSEVLIEEVPLAALFPVGDLVTQEGSATPGAEATGGGWAGPIEPVRVEAGEKLRITLTCEAPADGIGCSVTLIVDGEFD